MNKDYSISFVRFIAMFFIILCHIFQYFDNEAAWWFNVGVQLFLFISGWLYANKKINNYKQFYAKEFIKILLPYYIYLIIISIVYNVYIPNIINIKDIILSLSLCGTLKGLSHLWFIRYIVLCYLLLPLLYKVFKEEKVNKKTIINILVLFFIFELFGLLTKNFINGTWINCFILGFIVNRYKLVLKKNLLSWTIVILSFILIGIEIVIKYIFNIKFQGILSMIFNKYCNICHLLLCTLLFFLLRKIFEILKKDKIKHHILDFTDKLSYYIYITHHIYILGMLSFFNYIDSVYLSIILIMIVTLTSSYLLFLLTNFLKKFLITNKEKTVYAQK